MSWLIVALLSLAPSGEASAPGEQTDRWISCSAVETPHGMAAADLFARIFFEPGSAEITPQGEGLLDNFLSAYGAPDYCEVVVEGHADRIGSASYNLHLSGRRADAVAAYLRRGGLKASIVIEPRGEGAPLVETRDEVAEAQNRGVLLWIRDPRLPGG